MVSQKNDDQDDSSDVKIISENKTKENGGSSKNAMDIDIDLDDDDDSNFISNKRERSSKSFRSNNKQSPIKEELSSDSEDALVIDMEEESPKKKENNVKNNAKPQSPAKRKRSTSSNKTNESSEIKS